MSQLIVTFLTYIFQSAHLVPLVRGVLQSVDHAVMVPSVTTSQVTVPGTVLTAGKDLPARKVNEEKLLFPSSSRLVFTFLRSYEPPRGKTNNVVSEQV